ncbi:MAG: hypothetical protein R3213_08205 [Flavobacteriaceae bacterium]|nr:hypothetical protein [Flavobacteriaceae bacterium]
MPIDVKVDEQMLQELLNFTKNVGKAVEKGVEAAVKSQAENVKKQFRKRLEIGDVPGPPLSPGWLERKRELGLDTRTLMRHGRDFGDSYFHNVVTRKLGDLGHFVGVLKGTPAYDINRNASGKELTDVAEDLELRWPLWASLFRETWAAAPRVLEKHLIRELDKICPGGVKRG